MSYIPPVIPLDGTTIVSSPVEYSLNDESNHLPLISSSITLPSNTQQQNHLSSNLSGTTYSSTDQISNIPRAVGNVPTNDSSSVTRVLLTSPSSNDDLSSEQKNSLLIESSDQVNLSSLSFLQTKQRRINHRRNKSEPVITASLEDLSSNLRISQPSGILESSSTSTTSNESAISGNRSFEKKRKSSTKTSSPSTKPKQTTNGNALSSSTTKKKKPWYNPFQSTYRQRNEEFHKIFKDIPADERLIVDYSCAWQKEILIQGRMYISSHHLCFHANFLKWETSLSLKLQEILGITREKTAKVIPNAIEIRSNKQEKYFFASFATRDKTYAIIFRVWQAIQSNQPISSQQLWTLIHENYGNDLDMTTDEEDNHHRQSIHSTPDQTSPKQQIKHQTNEKYNRVTPNSTRSKSSEKEEMEDHSSMSSSRSGAHQTDNEDDDEEHGLIPIGEEANTNTLVRQPHSNPNKEEKPLPTTTTTEQTYLSKCPCQSHLATQLIDRTYPVSVDHLYDYIFENNDFLATYHASRRINEYHANAWQVNSETQKRERLCTYKVVVNAVFGPTTICSNEKQIIECELPTSHYVIDTEVRNEGIKYADAFFVATRYCLVQTGANKSHLKVTTEVRYVKSLMMLIKSFIEKNAMAALQDSYTDLNNRLEKSTSSVKRLESESSKRQRSSSITNNREKEKIHPSTTHSRKKHSRRQQSNESSPTNNDSLSQTNHQDVNETIPNSNTKITSRRWLTNNRLIEFCFITMLILLIVNIFLCVKLNAIDHMTDRLLQNYPLWSNGYSYPKEENEWSVLLKRQEDYYQTKLTVLRSVLISTHNALKNVTDVLNDLSKTATAGSNSNQPFDRLHSS